jgi:hypothetical protein
LMHATIELITTTKRIVLDYKLAVIGTSNMFTHCIPK